MCEISNIVTKLRTEFPNALVSGSDNELTIGFPETHISTDNISKIEEIVFYRGKLISNSKELIHVENAIVHVNTQYWSIFARVYEYLLSEKIAIGSADIDIDSKTVSFVLTNEYLNAAQLDVIQNIINEELGIHLTNHDSVRVFGHNSNHVMYLRLNKR